MRLAVFVIMLFSLLLVAACLQRLSRGSGGFTDRYAEQLNRLPISSPEDLEECQQGECWCMVCKNNTPIFLSRQNLIGGHCYMETKCNNERLTDLNNRTKTPDTFPLQFMIGQGTTFGDFGTSNTYCADRLSMSVQWLVGSENAPYLLPDAKRAMCFLSKGVMPVFILYSNGTDINETRAREIGEILGKKGKDYYQGKLTDGPVGPVIVVTEINFNESKASEVAAQVRAINQGCDNRRSENKVYCFVAVAPAMNDVAALDAVVDALGGTDGDWKNLVDFVAYGIDNRYTQTCSGSSVIQEALTFSGYSLYNHTKPTIVPYIMFDPGVTSKSACTWTERQVMEGYGAFFPTGILMLQKRGVIGIAPYTFNSTAGFGLTNPLNCTNCSVAATDARLKAFYGGCEKYAIYNRLGTPDVADTTQILFGNTSGTVCNANTQLSYMGGFSFANRNILTPDLSTEVNRAKLSYACDMCLIDNMSKNPQEYFPSLDPTRTEFNQEYCTMYPEVNQWASARNLDPMYIRAIIVTESGFKPCETAKVCKAGYDISKEASPDNAGCFDHNINTDDECYYSAYDEMYIPEDTPGFGTECPQLLNDIVPAGQLPRWRFCAVGMMQSLEPPISFWPASHRKDGADGQYYDIFKRAGISQSTDLDAAKACDPDNFNPFTAGDSICVGTAKMEKMFNAAKQWIASNKDKLNWNTDTEEDKTNIFAGYIAANKYSGIWDMAGTGRVTTSEWPYHPRCDTSLRNGDCWAIGFKESFSVSSEYCQGQAGQSDPRCDGGSPRNDPPGYCYGYTDFMKFVLDCEVPFLPTKTSDTDYKADRGRVKMEHYIKFVKDCEASSCPDGKRFFELAEKNLNEIGNPYLPNTPTPN